MDFAPLDNAIAKLSAGAAQLKAAEDAAGPLSADKADKINGELARAERKLLSSAGLPKRPWMQHVLYAPGWYTGYGVKTVPGVREAIEDGRFDDAKQQLVVVANAVNAEAEYLMAIAQEFPAK
jgi:N-acetylated-alpha-linked acidic dipeptidase